MTDRSASRTAVGVAFLRAVHQVLDLPPRVLDDPVALELIGPTGRARITDEAERFQTPEVRGLRAHIVLRSRFTEDRLAASIERGISRYVLLGAGFDTFAFRQPAWAHSLRVMEVDQPATQAAKRERLAAAGVALPTNVIFASIDFEHESLRDGLIRHGVSFADSTFFSWLGVTMYLTEEAVDAVLRTVAEFPPGSEIVFTFAQPRMADMTASTEAGRRSTLAETAATMGEPWLTYFTPDALERTLREIGFRHVEFLTPGESQRRYFADRKDGLVAPSHTSIVSATR